MTRALLLVLLVGLMAGCADSSIPAGSEGGACLPNGTCSALLSCLDQTCVLVDARVGQQSFPDASVPIADAAGTPDVEGFPDAESLDAGTPCTITNGTHGVCKDIAECTGTHTAGFCPGAANIQCCTP